MAVKDFKIDPILEIWSPLLFCLYLSSLTLYRKVFVLQTELEISLLKWIMFRPFSIFVARKFKQNCAEVWWVFCLFYPSSAWYYTLKAYNLILFPSKPFLSTMTSFATLDFMVNKALLTMSSRMEWSTVVTQKASYFDSTEILLYFFNSRRTGFWKMTTNI